MKRARATVFSVIFLLLLDFSLSHAKAVLKVICDIDGGKIYIDGKFKTECYNDDPVDIMLPAGNYTIVVKKFNKDGSYYYFKRKVDVGDGVKITITVNSKLKYTEDYYYKKAEKSQSVYDYWEYLEKYPKGKYVKQAKSKLKKVGYPVKIWDKTFGGKEEDGVSSIIKTKDNGYIIAGYTYSFGAGNSDAWVIKVDENGNELWNKTFGSIKEDMAKSIIETSDGGYIIAGYTYSFGAGNSDAWIIKVDKNGNKLWDKTFGDRFNNVANSIIKTKDGGYIIVGETWILRRFPAEIKGYISFAEKDIWIIKIDKNGNKLWDKTFGNLEINVANSIIETKNGDYVIAGYTCFFDFDEKDMWIIKIDGNGNRLWDKTFGEESKANSIIETKDGDYIIAGETWSFGRVESDAWVIKIDKNGNKLWDKTFGNKEKDIANSIIKTRDGGYIVAGYTGAFSDVWLIKINKDGNKLWDKTFGGEEEDEAKSIIETKDGDYIVAGETWSFGAGEKDIWVIKFKPLK